MKCHRRGDPREGSELLVHFPGLLPPGLTLTGPCFCQGYNVSFFIIVLCKLTEFININTVYKKVTHTNFWGFWENKATVYKKGT